MAHALLSTGPILDILARTPTALYEATSGLREADLRRRPEPDDWSLSEILAHLRASADIRGDQRIDRMLGETEPTFQTVSPRSAVAAAEYAAEPFSESLISFTSQRMRLLRQLRSLEPAEWQRGATLAGLRAPRYETVQSEADALVRHEVRHLLQVRRLSAFLHDDARARSVVRDRRAPSRGRMFERL